jgi:hypothetical protein
VPSDQKANFCGARTYSLSSKMTKLDYKTEVPLSCGPEDADFVAFVEATSLIGGCDVVEEFLACGLWPLGQQFGFEVETKESPLSKVLVPMPQVTAAIEEREAEAEFVSRIEDATNELVGRYNLTKHNSYQGLRHGQLNHIFELAKVLCQPRPEPIVWKHKFSVVVTASVPMKTFRKCGRGGKSNRSEAHTSA